MREINYKTPQDRIQVPKIKEILHNLIGSVFITKLDLKQLYLQFKIHQDSQFLFTFQWKGSQYSFKTAPYGYHSMTAQIQRVMSNLLSDIEGVQVFVDDIVISHTCIEKHRAAVKEVIRKLNKANLKLNPKKCNFATKEAIILGVKVNAQGLQADPDKKKRLIDWPLPKTCRDVHRAVGLANYIRDHIKDFAKITKKLSPVMKGKISRNITKEWTPELNEAWLELKEAIACSSTLAYPEQGIPFHIQTDGSDYAIGGTLFQIINGKQKNIMFFSKRLNTAQQRYGANTKELLALVYSIEHFQEYIKGSNISMWTDHKALERLNEQQKLHPIQARWIAKTFPYHFTITHIPGLDNELPDRLSRLHKDTFSVKESNILKEAKKTLQNEKDYTTLYTNEPREVSTVDWKLKPKYFDIVEEAWGKRSIDLFAALHNTQVPQKYYTREQNALQKDWSKESAPWANPPWELIPEVLQKVIKDKVSIAICVPYYPNAAWFPTWLSLLERDPIIIPNKRDTFLKEGRKVCGKTPWGETLIGQIGPNSPYFDTSIERIKLNTTEISEEERDRQQAQHDRWFTLIRQYHTVGHYTIEETIANLKKDGLEWPNMKAHAQICIEGCGPCLKNKIHKLGYHPLQSIKAKFPGDHVQIDTIGPLLESNRGNTYVLVWLDLCSSYVILRPMMNKSAQTVARILIQIFCEHGFPQKIQTDGGTEYTNKIMKCIIEAAPTEQLVNRPYQPKVLGANERSHRDIVPLIRKFVENNQGTWCSRLPFVQLGHNIRVSKRHKSSKFDVYFGRRSNQLTDYNQTVETEGTHQTWEMRRKQLEEHVMPQIENNIDSYQEKMRAAFEKKYENKYTKFQKGDIVMIQYKGDMNKMTAPYGGPYKIDRSDGRNGYYVVNMDGSTPKEYEESVLDERIGLVKANEQAEGFRLHNQPLPQQVHEFKRILDHRPVEGEQNSQEYLLEWDDGERTWTHEKDISDPDVIAKYRQTKRRNNRRNKNQN